MQELYHSKISALSGTRSCFQTLGVITNVCCSKLVRYKFKCCLFLPLCGELLSVMNLVQISFLLSLKNKLMEATMVRWHLVVLFLSESYLYRCYRLRLPISDTVTQELVNFKTFWIDKKIFYTRVSLGSVSNSWL